MGATTASSATMGATTSSSWGKSPPRWPRIQKWPEPRRISSSGPAGGATPARVTKPPSRVNTTVMPWSTKLLTATMGRRTSATS